jgi:hypothetical protein
MVSRLLSGRIKDIEEKRHLRNPVSLIEPRAFGILVWLLEAVCYRMKKRWFEFRCHWILFWFA